ATLHTAMGRHADSISEMQTACRLEPTSASLRSDFAWALHFARRFPEAEDAAKKALELDAWSYSAHRQLGKAYLLESKFADAVEEANRCLEINGGRRKRVLAEIAAAEAARGDRARAEQKLADAANGMPEDPVAHYEIAVAYARLGRPDIALQHLDTAVNQRLTRTLWMKTDPEMDPLREHPQFKRLLRRLNLE